MNDEHRMGNYISMKITFYIFFICLLGISNSVFAQSDVTESIDSYGNLIKTFGRDSVYTYSKSRELLSINYLDTLSTISRMEFEVDGKISRIEYNPQNTSDSLQIESFENGVLISRLYAVDYTIVSAGNPIQCYTAYKFYHPNGEISYSGQMGWAGGSGSSVGLHYVYNESGELVETIDFVFSEEVLENRSSYIIICEYYSNGKPRHRKIYINFGYYELDSPTYDDDDIHMRLGTWEYYDEQGNVVKTEKYSDLDERP